MKIQGQPLKSEAGRGKGGRRKEQGGWARREGEKSALILPFTKERNAGQSGAGVMWGRKTKRKEHGLS